MCKICLIDKHVGRLAPIDTPNGLAFNQKEIFESLVLNRESEWNIYISGIVGCGKTTLIKRYMEVNHGVNIYIDCIEPVSPSELFHEILLRLVSSIPRCKPEVPNITPTHRFIECLTDLVRVHKNFFHRSRIYIILDHVDQLERPLYNECLQLLNKLNEFYNPTDYTNFRTIMIAQCSIVGFRSLSELHSFKPLPLYMKPFDKKDIIEWICAHKPDSYSELYNTFVKNMISLFYEKTKSYVELRYLCQQSYDRFLTQIVSSYEVDDEDGDRTVDVPFSQLWKEFSESLKRDSSIYMNYLNRRQVPIRCDPLDALSLTLDNRIMLMSSYIAAHTTRADDKVNFSKEQSKSSRKFKRLEAENIDLRRNPFTLERVIQIAQRLKSNTFYERIHDPSDSDFTDSLHNAIVTLESCNLLRCCSRDGCSSANKYVITDVIDFAYAKKLAYNLELNIEHYLGIFG